MRLFVLGGTGKLGSALISQGAARGHGITAFSRSAGSSGASEMQGLVLGDPMRASEIASALPGHDVVLSALGSRGLGATAVRVDGARATIEAMGRTGLRRLIIVSSSLLDGDIGWFNRFAARTFLRHHGNDQRAMERLVTESDLDWTVVRPPRLDNGALTRRCAVTSGSAPPRATWMPMSRQDVAHMMLDAAEGNGYVKEIVWLRGVRG